MNIAIAIAKWLLTREHISAATPITVQVSGRTYSAARYSIRNNGSDEERLYVVGEMPPLHNRRRICYRTDDQSEETWHLVAWQRTNCAEWSEVNPFGSSHFILALWSPVETWAGDQCQRKPYRRIPMTITPCGGPTDASVTQPHEEKQDEPG